MLIKNVKKTNIIGAGDLGIKGLTNPDQEPLTLRISLVILSDGENHVYLFWEMT